MIDADSFEKELTELINKNSMENYCDVPDYILAQMIIKFIIHIGLDIKRTLDWHGCVSVCHPRNKRIKESICDTAPYPQCNGANGCDTCEHQGEV